MNDVEFVNWFKGYLDISKCESIGEAETAVIKANLQSVFIKETKTTVSPTAPGPIFGMNSLGSNLATATSDVISVSC